MKFHEIRFPTNLSFGSLGGPERLTDVVTLVNGFEERNTPWEHSRRRYDAGIGMRSLDDVGAMIAFFEARRGQLHGFRWKDWSDFKSCRPSHLTDHQDQRIGFGDGITKAFKLTKLYTSGGEDYVRPIVKPVVGTVKMALAKEPRLEGQDFAVDFTTGIVTFTDAPDIDVLITAGFEFDVPVRFDTNRIQTSVASFKAGEIPNVPILEVRL